MSHMAGIAPLLAGSKTERTLERHVYDAEKNLQEKISDAYSVNVYMSVRARRMPRQGRIGCFLYAGRI